MSNPLILISYCFCLVLSSFCKYCMYKSMEVFIVFIYDTYDVWFSGAFHYRIDFSLSNNAFNLLCSFISEKIFFLFYHHFVNIACINPWRYSLCLFMILITCDFLALSISESISLCRIMLLIYYAHLFPKKFSFLFFWLLNHLRRLSLRNQLLLLLGLRGSLLKKLLLLLGLRGSLLKFR